MLKQGSLLSVNGIYISSKHLCSFRQDLNFCYDVALSPPNVNCE